MILIFTGIPASGKTTIAKRLLPRLKKLGTVKMWISDNFKPPIYRKFFELLRKNRGKYDFLIFDATFFKEKHRQKMKKLAKGEEVMTIYVDCPLKTALQRNKTRAHRIPVKGVHFMHREFEPPKRPDIRIPSEKMSAQQAARRIFTAIERDYESPAASSFSLTA